MENNEKLEELKSEAAALGIKHNANIGEDKLQEKIDAHYEAQETSGPAIAAIVAETEIAEEAESTASVVKSSKRLDPKLVKRKKREADAKKTRVITIIDNDQRQNNQTTTCIVNCSNQFFDLGTRILPLGEKIEVAQGHINVLKEVFIPIHNKNPKTGLAVTKIRQRYSISYEDAKE